MPQPRWLRPKEQPAHPASIDTANTAVVDTKTTVVITMSDDMLTPKNITLPDGMSKGHLWLLVMNLNRQFNGEMLDLLIDYEQKAGKGNATDGNDG